jgi:hypothetical protein
MTKKLEELLNLPETKELVYNEQKSQFKNLKDRKDVKEIAPADNLFRNIDEIDKISAALPQVKGLGEISDSELDELAQRATDAYDDLMDLGMNVEPRYSSRVFEVASTMLKNAIDAKSAKIDKKLKMIELQIKKQQVDQKSKPAGDNELEGEGYLITDRNSLLEKLKNIK